jgi:NarL family two-component system response regulator LiaR
MRAPELGVVVDGADSQCCLMPIRLLIVDDHDFVRDTISAALAGHSQIEVVGRARDGVEAVEAAVEVKPDVVLMDLMMPRLDGIAATRLLRKLCPDSRVVVLTSATPDSPPEAKAAGATSVIAKDAALTTVVDAIVAAATA